LLGICKEVENKRLLRWIPDSQIQIELKASFCPVSSLLSTAGLLDGGDAIMHHRAELLSKTVVSPKIPEEVLFTMTESIITPAGISVRIDLAFLSVSYSLEL